MGELVSGNCRCGFSVEGIMLGSGERPGYYFAYACYDCKILTSRIHVLTQLKDDLSKVKETCGSCNKVMNRAMMPMYTDMPYYNSIPGQKANEISRSSQWIRKFSKRYFSNGMNNWIYSAFYRKNEPMYITHCPGCGQFRLKLYDTGSFD